MGYPMREKIAALYDLQQQDSAIDVIKLQYSQLDAGRAELVEYNAALAAQKAAKKAQHAANAEFKDVELEYKAVEAKRATEETKLYSGKVTNPKELQSLTDEVAMLERNRDNLGEKVEIATQKLEAAKTLLSESQKALILAEKALKAKQAAFEEQAETIRAQARIISAQRNEAVKNVSANLLKQYDTLRAAKGGKAVSALEDANSCGGCKMGLSSSLVRRIHEGSSIEFCDNCGRILCLVVV